MSETTSPLPRLVYTFVDETGIQHDVYGDDFVEQFLFTLLDVAVQYQVHQLECGELGEITWH